MVMNEPHACFQAIRVVGVHLISTNFVFMPIYTVFSLEGSITFE